MEAGPSSRVHVNWATTRRANDSYRGISPSKHSEPKLTRPNVMCPLANSIFSHVFVGKARDPLDDVAHLTLPGPYREALSLSGRGAISFSTYRRVKALVLRRVEGSGVLIVGLCFQDIVTLVSRETISSERVEGKSEVSQLVVDCRLWPAS